MFKNMSFIFLFHIFSASLKSADEWSKDLKYWNKYHSWHSVLKNIRKYNQILRLH